MNDETPHRAGSRGRWWLVGLIALPAVAFVIVALFMMVRSELVVVEVPAGTAARIDAGETVELLPRTMEVAVGDTLEIRNLDDATHEVGPYVVAAGQTVRQTFTTPGVIQGMCTLHPSGEITIIVR